MSVRLSTALPRACSGLMYAAVPRSVSEIYGLKRLRATNDHDGSDLQLFF
jgi:hypothetical protein